MSFSDAATLPIAGLTALRALRRGGDLVGKRVLIVPGTGGVGLFAIQLAAIHGARVTAVVRNPAHQSFLSGIGAEQTIVGTTADARKAGPYDLILESLGGASLGAAMTLVAPDGCVVNFGNTIEANVTFDCRKFFYAGGASLYGFAIFHEVRREPMARDLERAGRVDTRRTARDARRSDVPLRADRGCRRGAPRAAREREDRSDAELAS